MIKLQNRLILIIVFGIVLATMISGMISLFTFVSLDREKTGTILEKDLELGASYFDEKFNDAENFVETLSDYCLTYCPDISELTGPVGQAYIDDCRVLAATFAGHNTSVCGAYFRLESAIVGGTTKGFFLTSTPDHTIVTEHEMTDLSLYDPDDIGHVGWYYAPIETGKPVWIDEYLNENTGVLMISYVAPLYLEDGTLLGIAGVDINMENIYEHISEISTLDGSVTALMSDSGEIRDAEKNIRLTDEDKARIIAANSEIGFTYLDGQKETTLVAMPLLNGDYLLLTIENALLRTGETKVLITTLVVTVAVCALIVGLLMGTVFRMIRRFRTDPLTQFENRSSYEDAVSEIDAAIRAGRNPIFTVIVFDVNALKQTNDRLGHTHGDALLKNAADLIKQYFPKMTIYRIGGDEFAILSNHRVSSSLSYQLEKFRKQMEENARHYDFEAGTVAISSGMAVYDAGNDDRYEDAFRRADQEMYTEKVKFYQFNPQFDRRKDKQQ